MKANRASIVFLFLGVGIGLIIGLFWADRARPPQPKKSAISVLVQGLQGDVEARRSARVELKRRGSAAVPGLIAAAKGTNQDLRWEAVNILGALGDRRSTEVLVSRVLEDEDVHVRWRSIWAIKLSG